MRDMTRRRLGRLAASACCAVLLTVAAACGGAAEDAADRTSWPTTGTPVASDGLVWASGAQVHLPDGSVIDTGDLAGAYVVAGPGVWFASSEPGELEPGELPELMLATREGVRATGAHPGVGSLTATADGRWLAFVDRLDGGAGRAEAVVVDLDSGEEVVRSDEGLVPAGDDDQDWVDLYEDAPVSMLGVVDGTAYVRGLDDVVVHDLSTGEVSRQALSGTELVEQGWWRELHRDAPLPNEDASWSILAQGYSDPVTVLRSADGAEVTTSSSEAEEWLLGGWLDATTAIGTTPRAGGDDWTNPALITCRVPDGACTVVEGTEEGVNLPVDRPFGLPREDALDPS